MGTIDLADPSSEGFRVATALREAGFEVRVREVDDLRAGTDGGLVILAGDAEGAVDTLSALRQAEGTKTAPILLVGTPEQGPADAEGLTSLGADAFYERPVEVERLVRKVETFFAPQDRRLRSPETDLAHRETDPERPRTPPRPPRTDDAPDAGDAGAADGQGEEDGRPEPTIQLGDSSDAWMAPSEEEDEPVSPAPDPVRQERVAPSSPAPSDALEARAGSEHPDDASHKASGPELSTRLTRLLAEADRRMFPNEPPLQIRFPGGDEPPEELVPDELLASVSLPIESVAEDPLDAFTFVGSLSDIEAEAEGAIPPPPMTPSSQSGEESAGGEREGEPSGGASQDDMPGGGDSSSISVVRSAGSSVVTSTGERGGVGERRGEREGSAATVDALDVGEPTPDGRGRQGQLDRGEALRLLWRLYDHRVDARVRLTGDTQDAGHDVELVLREGEVTAVRGPVATRVLGRLRRDGRIAEAATDEEAAWSLLERGIRAGLLARLEVDRRLRVAREQLVHELLDASALRFEATPAEDTASGSAVDHALLLSAPLPVVLVEGARRRLDTERVAGLLGDPERLEIRLGSDLHARARHARIAPELVSLLERHEGDTLGALLAEVAPDEGVAGLVLALSEVGALRLMEGSESRGERPVEAVRRAVEAAAARADESDYFTLLGVRAGAPARELRAAWVARRRELVGLPLAACGLESLEAERDRAIDALDEAWEILRDERLNKAYRAALAAVGERC